MPKTRLQVRYFQSSRMSSVCELYRAGLLQKITNVKEDCHSWGGGERERTAFGVSSMESSHTASESKELFENIKAPFLFCSRIMEVAKAHLLPIT